MRSDQRRGPARNQKTPRAAGQQVADPLEPSFLLHFVVEQEKGRRVQQQVIPGDVHKRMSEHAPPFALGYEAGQENHVRRTSAVEQGQVDQEEDGCQRAQLDAQRSRRPGHGV